MRFGALFLGLGLLFVGIGCKKQSPLVGTWTYTPPMMKANAQVESTFNADGTLKQVMHASRQDGKASLIATDTGTWTLTGDKLTEKFTDIDWQFSGGTPAALQKAQDRFAQNKAKILASTNENPTETITWAGDDQFSITKEGKTYTYNRKK